jgi:hypothetical protein
MPQNKKDCPCGVSGVRCIGEQVIQLMHFVRKLGSSSKLILQQLVKSYNMSGEALCLQRSMKLCCAAGHVENAEGRKWQKVPENHIN